MNFWMVVFLVAVLLVGLDKTFTYINIKEVQKNYPSVDALKIEKNPLARWSFQKMGLLGGTIFYFIFSIGTFMVAVWALKGLAGLWAPANALGVSFYIVTMAYFLVLGNNFYFFLKFSKIIP